MPTVYVTASRDAGADIARGVVEARLAACVNRIDCASTYRWEGDVVEDDEEVLLMKTTDARYEELVAHVREVHPYDVPCIERFDEESVDEAFGAWRAESVE